VFAPNADLGRDIRWGRTEECYGEDAYLAGHLTVAYVKGLQGDHPKYWKTASLMKHFLANSNENNRFINSSDFDERLFYEYYGYAFYKGIVEGGSRAYMAAYNKYNGIPCTVHPVLKEVTVEEWGQNHVASDGREEVDRQAISLEQEDLVKLVKAVNPNTVLVLVSSFPYAIPWSKDNVPAILHITQSSQELGNGFADVIFGELSPAGRLVQTWPASIDELLPILDYNIRNGRTYMYDRHTPLFAFGHGLSYTTFEYSGLEMSKSTIKDGDVVEVTLRVTNTGALSSDEVVQLYVRFPESQVEQPIKALKGFKRVHVPAGESIFVTIPLKADDLKYWDEERHEFVLEKGNVEILLGASSADIRLTGSIMAE